VTWTELTLWGSALALVFLKVISLWNTWFMAIPSILSTHDRCSSTAFSSTPEQKYLIICLAMYCETSLKGNVERV